MILPFYWCNSLSSFSCAGASGGMMTACVLTPIEVCFAFAGGHFWPLADPHFRHPPPKAAAKLPQECFPSEVWNILWARDKNRSTRTQRHEPEAQLTSSSHRRCIHAVWEYAITDANCHSLARNTVRPPASFPTLFVHNSSAPPVINLPQTWTALLGSANRRDGMGNPLESPEMFSFCGSFVAKKKIIEMVPSWELAQFDQKTITK